MFSEAPERFDTIDVILASSELVLAGLFAAGEMIGRPRPGAIYLATGSRAAKGTVDYLLKAKYTGETF